MAKRKKSLYNPAEHEIARCEGSQPKIPDNWEIGDAIKFYTQMQQDYETEVQFSHLVEGVHWLDAAVAAKRALAERYGWAKAVPTPTFFGPMPPEVQKVAIGPGPRDKEDVILGEFSLPDIKGGRILFNRAKDSKGNPVLAIYGVCTKRYAHIPSEIFNRTCEIARENSIYKGRAVQVPLRSDGTYDAQSEFTFVNLEAAQKTIDELILNDGESDQVDTSVWTPIRHTAKCRELNIPLKRGVLLSGPYGVGKTMTARATAAVCQENGWTYLICDNTRALGDVLAIARLYQPAVVFCEDVERVAGDRQDAGNDLLNVVDGALHKDSEVIVILTTNHPEAIHPAMLRPGRLDAVVSFRAPEPNTVTRLIRQYAGDNLPEGESLDIVSGELAGQIPATVREVVERSKLGMIARGSDTLAESDLLTAARGMKAHLDLLNRDRNPAKTPELILGESLRDVLIGRVEGSEPGVDSVAASLKRLRDLTQEIHDSVS